MPIISGGGSGGSGGIGPGYEWSYTQRTTSVAVVSGTEASGTTVLSPAAFTPDGGAVLVEFFALYAQTPSSAIGAKLTVSLFESTTQLTRIAVAACQDTTGTNDIPLVGSYRFTPSATAHTYTVTAFADSQTGAPTIIAGSGGTGGLPPCFVRFTKV